MAGALVSVRGTVRDEVRVAGAEVDLDVVTKDDAKVAGAIVSIKGGVGKDLYVAGVRVNVDALIGGSLKGGGARVLIGSQSKIEGPCAWPGLMWCSQGPAAGSVEIYGDTVQIDGRIGSDLLVRARNVTVGKTAVVEGNAIFQTLDEPQIEEGALLRGRQTFASSQPSPHAALSIVKALFATLLFGIGAGFILGLILLVTARSFVEQAISQVRDAPVRSAIFGLAVVILVPLLAAILMMTVIGIPLSLTLLAFPLMLFVGLVVAAFAVGDLIFDRDQVKRSFGSRLLLLLAGLFVITLTGVVPVVGVLLWGLVMLLGVGATVAGASGKPVR